MHTAQKAGAIMQCFDAAPGRNAVDLFQQMQHDVTGCSGVTSSKKTAATLRYKGLLKPKSTEKVSQVLLGEGPTLKSHVLSKWSNSVLSKTLEMTCSPGFKYTSEVYLNQSTQLLR